MFKGRGSTIHLITFCAACMLAEMAGFAQALAETTAPIENLSQSLNITNATRTLYAAGQYYVCVQTGAEGYFLWNIKTDVLTPADGPYCHVAGMALTVVNTEVASSYEPHGPSGHAKALQGDLLETAAGFSGAEAIGYEDESGGGKCSTNITFHYRISYPNGKAVTFFVVERLRRPRIGAMPFGCEVHVGERVVQKFDVSSGLRSIDIGDGRTLFMLFDHFHLEFVFLRMARLPDHVWGNGYVFLVPRDPLVPELGDKDSPDGPDIGTLQDRYNVLLRALGSATTEVQ